MRSELSETPASFQSPLSDAQQPSAFLNVSYFYFFIFFAQMQALAASLWFSRFIYWYLYIIVSWCWLFTHLFWTMMYMNKWVCADHQHVLFWKPKPEKKCKYNTVNMNSCTLYNSVFFLCVCFWFFPISNNVWVLLFVFFYHAKLKGLVQINKKCVRLRVWNPIPAVHTQ